jgi:cell division protein FtsB
MVPRILRRRALWVLVGALGVSVLISSGAIRRYGSRYMELNRLEDRRDEMRRKVDLLEARRVRAEHDEEFIETAARRELGLLAPDEIEFRFVATTSTSPVAMGGR